MSELKERIQSLVKAFGSEVGLKDLCLDDDGFCAMSINDVMVGVELDEEGNRLLWYAMIGNVPQNCRMEFYERLLDANHFWNRTFGATLSVEKGTGLVTLAYSLPTELVSLDSIVKVTANFSEAAGLWVACVLGFEGEKETIPSNADSSSLKTFA